MKTLRIEAIGVNQSRKKESDPHLDAERLTGDRADIVEVAVNLQACRVRTAGNGGFDVPLVLECAGAATPLSWLAK